MSIDGSGQSFPFVYPLGYIGRLLPEVIRPLRLDPFIPRILHFAKECHVIDDKWIQFTSKSYLPQRFLARTRLHLYSRQLVLVVCCLSVFNFCCEYERERERFLVRATAVESISRHFKLCVSFAGISNAPLNTYEMGGCCWGREIQLSPATHPHRKKMIIIKLAVGHIKRDDRKDRLSIDYWWVAEGLRLLKRVVPFLYYSFPL